jgi:hypothetical protein
MSVIEVELVLTYLSMCKYTDFSLFLTTALCCLVLRTLMSPSIQPLVPVMEDKSTEFPQRAILGINLVCPKPSW